MRRWYLVLNCAGVLWLSSPLAADGSEPSSNSSRLPPAAVGDVDSHRDLQPILAKTTHWAYVPPRAPAIPAVIRRGWVRNAIDAFILARLEQEQLTPAPEADRATLIRRLSLDLVGLTPCAQEVDDFLKDTAPDAYERLVERLLASPHYGERWGRHWLDAARYADSNGFYTDADRPSAWRWRDWVIAALNGDLRFDQFTIEQLAGDLLPNATLEQRIATGFHRNAPMNDEAGVDPEQVRVDAIIDRVNTTGQVFLGATLGCAQCHDHKYDPLSQREYYQLLAFFNSDVEEDLTAPLPGELQRYQKQKAAYDHKAAQLQAAVDAYRETGLPQALQQWEAGLTLAQLRQLPDNVRAVLLCEPAQRSAAQQGELAEYYASIDARLAELTNAVASHLKTAPHLSTAPTLVLGPSRQTHVMIRGDYLRPGIAVAPGVPGVLHPLPTTSGPPTRLHLARWMVDPANPLTARVLTNWVWHKYFGRGLVPTLEDFGIRGERPSHPALLDYLATEFVRRQWSLKDLHRLIVTSATYRQSSRPRPELVSRDPSNLLLARQNRLRLEAEVIRDNALAASGLLVHRVGGPSVRPPRSEKVNRPWINWVEETGRDRHRRGLYIWSQRSAPFPMLLTFDAPDSTAFCVRRARSNTPLQSLTLLNDPVFIECARALGRRLVAEQPGPVAERIRHSFRLCLAREPLPDELPVLNQLYERLRQATQARPEVADSETGPALVSDADPAEVAAWVVWARVLLNLDEFVTRE